MLTETKNPDIFHVHREIGYPPVSGCAYWPWAGQKLTPELRAALGLHPDQNPSRIIIEGTHQDYRIAANGYLIPYYATSRFYDSEAREDISAGETIIHRNETLLVARARSFSINSQPEIAVPRSKADIKESIGEFVEMADDTYAAQARKIGQFKLIVGSVVARLETLGRIITQGNGYGAQIEYPDIRDAASIPPKRINDLRKEFQEWYKFIMQQPLVPLLRTVLFSDRSIDRDGILIDLIREIGKPLDVEDAEQEEWVRGHIIGKIGNAMESIDEIHDQLVNAILRKPIGPLFEKSLKNFFKESGDKFEIDSVKDVVKKLDHYAALCKARCGVRGDDRKAYDEIFREKSALNGLFIPENGLLESMQFSDAANAAETQALRTILRRGIRLMERTAYTRTPCNHTAPEIWIPTAKTEDSIEPIEKYLNERFVLSHNRARIAKIFAAAQGLSPNDTILFKNKSFSSLGILTADLKDLSQKLQPDLGTLLTARGRS